MKRRQPPSTSPSPPPPSPPPSPPAPVRRRPPGQSNSDAPTTQSVDAVDEEDTFRRSNEPTRPLVAAADLAVGEETTPVGRELPTQSDAESGSLDSKKSVPYLHQLVRRVAKAEKKEEIVQLAVLIKPYVSTLQAACRQWSTRASSRAEKMRILRKGIGAFKRRKLAAGSRAWIDFYTGRKHLKRLLRSAASSFRGDGMRKAWNGWLGLLHDREVMASAVYCSTHRLQRAGFASWVSATKGSVTKLLLRLRDDVSSICSLSLAKRSLRKAINSWSENVEPYRMYAIAGHRLKLCLLGRGLATWVSCWRSDVRSARELRRKVLEHVPLVALKAIQTEDETILWPSEDDNASPTGSRFPSPSPPPSP